MSSNDPTDRTLLFRKWVTTKYPNPRNNWLLRFIRKAVDPVKFLEILAKIEATEGGCNFEDLNRYRAELPQYDRIYLFEALEDKTSKRAVTLLGQYVKDNKNDSNPVSNDMLSNGA